jgi:hypothetical protein
MPRKTVLRAADIDVPPCPAANSSGQDTPVLTPLRPESVPFQPSANRRVTDTQALSDSLDRQPLIYQWLGSERFNPPFGACAAPLGVIPYF